MIARASSGMSFFGIWIAIMGCSTSVRWSSNSHTRATFDQARPSSEAPAPIPSGATRSMRSGWKRACDFASRLLLINESNGLAKASNVKMLKKKTVTKTGVAPGAISKPDEIKSKIASQRIYAGEQVTINRFASVSQSGVQGSLKGTLRAYQVAGTANQTLAGILKVGDHVDVVANFRYKWANQSQTSSSVTYAATKIVLRNLKVLRAPAAPPSPGPASDQ